MIRTEKFERLFEEATMRDFADNLLTIVATCEDVVRSDVREGRVSTYPGTVRLMMGDNGVVLDEAHGYLALGKDFARAVREAMNDHDSLAFSTAPCDDIGTWAIRIQHSTTFDKIPHRWGIARVERRTGFYNIVARRVL